MAIPTVPVRGLPPQEEVYGLVPNEDILIAIQNRLVASKASTDETERKKKNDGRKAGWEKGYNWAVGEASYYALKDKCEETLEDGQYFAEGYRAACRWIFKRVDA